MAYFRVLIHGAGIRIPCQDGDGTIVGFYTTRAVRAASINEAIDSAKALVIAEWACGPYHESNAGEHPSLVVHEVYAEHFLGYLMFRNKGYTFYTYSDEGAT